MQSITLKRGESGQGATTTMMPIRTLGSHRHFCSLVPFMLKMNRHWVRNKHKNASMMNISVMLPMNEVMKR